MTYSWRIIMNEKDKPSVDVSVVLGYIATKDLQTTEKKVAVLTALGFSNADMARICSTNEDVIRALKSKLKKGG
jgi:DNA-binding CsgD family transcriptional regulator